MKQKDYIKKELSQRPPVPCDFKVGDKVIFKNDYGVEFELTVLGFSNGTILKNGAFIHLDGGAYWFPHLPDCLRHN